MFSVASVESYSEFQHLLAWPISTSLFLLDPVSDRFQTHSLHRNSDHIFCFSLRVMFPGRNHICDLSAFMRDLWLINVPAWLSLLIPPYISFSSFLRQLLSVTCSQREGRFFTFFKPNYKFPRHSLCVFEIKINDKSSWTKLKETAFSFFFKFILLTCP